MTTSFTPPIRATRRCRHYSYEMGALLANRGSKCACGLDMSAPAAANVCMPDPSGTCKFREDYTAEERAAWDGWVAESMARLSQAISALPAPIPLNSQGEIVCPNCAGRLHYARWHRGASLACETDHCCAARFSIEAGADWPQREAQP